MADRPQIAAGAAAEMQGAQAREFGQRRDIGNLGIAELHVFELRQKTQDLDVAHRTVFVAKMLVPAFDFRKYFRGAAKGLLGVARIVSGVERALALALDYLFHTRARIVWVPTIPPVGTVFDDQFRGVAFFNGACVVQSPTDESFGIHRRRVSKYF